MVRVDEDDEHPDEGGVLDNRCPIIPVLLLPLLLLVERSIVRDETAWCFWLALLLVDITTSGGAVECPFTRGSSGKIRGEIGKNARQ